MKKIIAFDVDGTLLDDDKKLNPKTISALAQLSKQNYILALCSGRPYQRLINFAEQCGNSFKYLICNNGSYFVDIEKDIFFMDKFIKVNQFSEIVKFAKSILGICIVHYSDGSDSGFNSTIPSNESNFDNIESEVKKGVIDGETPISSLDDALEKIKMHKIIQFSIRATKEKVVKSQDKVDSIVNLKEVDFHVGNEVYYDFVPYGINKFEGIKQVCEREDILLENTICFGDSDNDLDMLEKCAMSFCMSNGTEKAKSVAKKIIGNNNSDAISEILLSLI